MTTNRPPVTEFIGRQQELSVLTVALDDAMQGQGRVAMIAGEPGIGKPRITQELTAVAQGRAGR
ncbi:MAG: hypothetical protein CL759_11695 [Chloroflexi bacterium]|nr:hypothetical protein [Chloroflexota bacterium]